MDAENKKIKMVHLKITNKIKKTDGISDETLKSDNNDVSTPIAPQVPQNFQKSFIEQFFLI